MSAPRILTPADLAIASVVSAALECAHAAAYESEAAAIAVPSILALADRQTDTRADRVLRVIAAAIAFDDSSGALSFVSSRLAQHSYAIACEAAQATFTGDRSLARVTMDLNRKAAADLGLGAEYDHTLARLQPPEVRP